MSAPVRSRLYMALNIIFHAFAFNALFNGVEGVLGYGGMALWAVSCG